MIRSFFGYVRDSAVELRHVSWPTRQDVVRHTIIIIISVVIATLIITAVDYGLSFLVDQFLLT